MRMPTFVIAAIAVALCLPAGQALAQADSTGISFDGLERVEDAEVGFAYVDPEADFGNYSRIMILDPHVAFRDNWKRDQNRRSRSQRLRASDVDRIKRDVAALFRDVFIERLEADDGFEIVNEAGDDVLLVRPAILDLDISAPDTSSAGRSRTFTANAGAATIYVELFDSVTGDILGRAADRQATRSAGGMMTWTNRVTNQADARRMMGGWADTLRGFLEQHYQSDGGS